MPFWWIDPLELLAAAFDLWLWWVAVPAGAFLALCWMLSLRAPQRSDSGR